MKSDEQVEPTILDVGCRYPTVVIIRLSQPSLAGVGAKVFFKFYFGAKGD